MTAPPDLVARLALLKSSQTGSHPMTLPTEDVAALVARLREGLDGN